MSKLLRFMEYGDTGSKRGLHRQIHVTIIDQEQFSYFAGKDLSAFFS